MASEVNVAHILNINLLTINRNPRVDLYNIYNELASPFIYSPQLYVLNLRLNELRIFLIDMKYRRNIKICLGSISISK